ncbi:MAG TPA: hypothetical protein VMW27_12200 [Thermoanaerobaculia bacterium]|nr:hypothetical protein [Thermoanaerobaculia bacterium]
MPTQRHDTPRPSIDLTQVTEATRRALYDAVVDVHFSYTPSEVQQAAEDPENHWAPDYGPDETGLTVVWALGRWFAVWRCLDESEGAPEEQRWSVVRITSDRDGPSGLSFLEV